MQFSVCLYTCVDMKLPMDSYNYYIHLAKLQDLMKFKVNKITCLLVWMKLFTRTSNKTTSFNWDV